MKMKYLPILLALVLVVTGCKKSSPAEVINLQFISHSNLYSLNIPSGWAELPNDYFERSYGESDIPYETGFYNASAEKIKYPYILTSVYDQDHKDYAAVKEEFIKKRGTNEGDIIIATELAPKDSDTQGAAAVISGNDMIIRLLLVSRPDEYAQAETVLLDMVDSFEFLEK